MNQRFRFLLPELELPATGLLLLDDEFLQKERGFCDIQCVMSLNEIGILVAECEDTTGLAADDGITILNEPIKLPDIEFCIFAGFFRQTFRNHRSTATFSLWCN